MEPSKAYKKAKNSKYSSELENFACDDPYYAYLFAKTIPGADIYFCQKHACKESYWAYAFAASIPNADVLFCQKKANDGFQDPWLAFMFSKNVKGANHKQLLFSLKEGYRQKYIQESIYIGISSFKETNDRFNDVYTSFSSDTNLIKLWSKFIDGLYKFGTISKDTSNDWKCLKFKQLNITTDINNV